MNIASTIGSNIKSLREQMGFSQTTIASFLNVDQSLISKVEKGERNLSIDMLEKLSYLFGVSIDFIESNNFEVSNLLIAFRTNELKTEDLEAICAINRIALNSEAMAQMLKR